MATGYEYLGECLQPSEYHSIQKTKFNEWLTNKGCYLYNWNRKSVGSYDTGLTTGFGYREVCNGNVSGDRTIGYTDGVTTCELPQEIIAVDGDGNTINYTDATAFWGFAFVTTMALWLGAKKLGMIIDAAKKWR